MKLGIVIYETVSCKFIYLYKKGLKVDKYQGSEQFDFNVSLYIFMKCYGKLVRNWYVDMKLETIG